MVIPINSYFPCLLSDINIIGIGIYKNLKDAQDALSTMSNLEIALDFRK